MTACLYVQLLSNDPVVDLFCINHPKSSSSWQILYTSSTGTKIHKYHKKSTTSNLYSSGGVDAHNTHLFTRVHLWEKLKTDPNTCDLSPLMSFSVILISQLVPLSPPWSPSRHHGGHRSEERRRLDLSHPGTSAGSGAASCSRRRPRGRRGGARPAGRRRRRLVRSAGQLLTWSLGSPTSY